MNNNTFHIRKAERQDTHLILDFIRGIARYEKMEDEVVADVHTLEQQLFDLHRAEVIFAVENGREVGLPCSFTTSPPFWAEAVSIWKTSMSSPSTVARVMAKPSFSSSPA